MKKYRMLFLFTLMIVMLTGCGKEKSFTCTYDLDTNEIKTKMEYTFHFDKKGEKLISYEKKDTAEYLKEINEEDFEKDYQTVLKSCDDMKDLKGVECSIEKENKKLSSKIEVNLNDLDSDGKDSLFTREAEEKNYDEFKSMMEQTGFTCK